MKVLVKTPLNPYSGYGQDGIGIVRSLLRMGLDVYVDPSFVQPPLPPEVASTLTKRLQAPFDLLIHHADPAQLGISPEARKAAKVTMAWTMWEMTSLDNCKGRSKLRKALRNYDAVFGYDSVSSGALAPYVPASTQAATLQGGFWPEEWPAVQRDWHSERFGFCMVGALHQRKDPFVAIQAFKELKDEYPQEFDGAELHLKTNVPGLHMAMEQWVPKLRVHYNVWMREILQEFYASQHVLLAPSRGEGKNMPALEFMSTGGAVIATNFGGHKQWLSSAYAYPLSCDLVPESPEMPNCLSARAHKDVLKNLMWHTFNNRDEVKMKAEQASRLIPAMCSWEAVMDRLFLKLGELVPGGDRLLHEARARKEIAQATSGLDFANLVPSGV